MSCLQLTISRIAVPIKVFTYRKTSSLNVTVTKVCSVGIDENNREIFMVKDGVFLLSDGKTFKVVRKNGI